MRQFRQIARIYFGENRFEHAPHKSNIDLVFFENAKPVVTNFDTVFCNLDQVTFQSERFQEIQGINDTFVERP